MTPPLEDIVGWIWQPMALQTLTFYMKMINIAQPECANYKQIERTIYAVDAVQISVISTFYKCFKSILSIMVHPKTPE